MTQNYPFGILSPVLVVASLLLLCLLLGDAVAAPRKRKQTRFEAPKTGAPQEKLPAVCYGDSLKYGVKGENGKALFLWSV